MKVLVGCEYSGKVRDALIRRGHDAVSCDLYEEGEGEFRDRHFKEDIFVMLERDRYDLLIAFPPCTYLCSSGLHWNGRVAGRAQKTEDALDFVSRLLNADVPRIALENPVGRINTAIRRPDQCVQPWEFGHPESKKTCLWLKNLPRLVPTNVLQKPASGRWDNQTASGQNNLGPSADRAKIRGTTYTGIAEAMAEQWGGNQTNRAAMYGPIGKAA